MNLLKSLLIFIVLCCIPYFSHSQSNENRTKNDKRLDQLILKDSIYEATIILNEDIAYAKTHNLPLDLALANEKLGTIFYNIESYDSASSYYLTAFKLFDSLNKIHYTDRILCNLSKTYVHAKDYEKFDSIIPIALNHSHELNSISTFYNLGSKVIKNYLTKNYENTYKYAEEALLKLETFPFDTAEEKAEKRRLEMSFNYYKALSMINLKQFDPGYTLLFTIDPNQFSTKVQHNTVPLSQIATLNYYKFRYFDERTKQADSANYYLLKSDYQKYDVIKDFHNKLAKKGDLIYKIITTENELKIANAKREEEKAMSNVFFAASIVLSLLLIGSATFFHYYYNNRKRIKKINLTLKESNKKLKIIDKERLEFFSILSHELRTPIYGINGLATLIDQEKSPEKKKSYLNALISSSNYISILIDNVLQISKPKFENKKLHLKPTNILQLVKRISSSIKFSANQKGLELYTNVEKTNWNEFLLIDKVVLSQILINLIYNAIRYTSKGYVSLNVSEQQRTDTHVTLLFEIKDSGIGIQSKHADIIFNAFENKTFLEKNSSGSGLGLHIVKTLLKSYNSEIKFVSKPNEGSTFYFDVDFEIAEAPSEENHLSDSGCNTPIKILVVDDNTINLLVTQKNVNKISGCTSETASHGKEAICLVKEKDFDLVLMDINMPDMDGFEATKHIRLFNPTIPVLALTALNSAEIQDKATACGINYVITKPYDFEDFKSLILKFSNVFQD